MREIRSVELNWTTIVLEIINFLVLVWILKRFLYQPILRVIEERRSRIDSMMIEADQRQESAEKLQSQYENRLAEWQREKREARETFEHELQQQRAQAVKALETRLAAERKRAEVVENRRARELAEGREKAALEIGARFASRLLESLAGPELEGRIVVMVAEELDALPDAQRAALRRATDNGEAAVQVQSAHTLTDDQRGTLERALKRLLGEGAACIFDENPLLIAGVHLSVGDWSMGANLRDELKGFADKARELD